MDKTISAAAASCLAGLLLAGCASAPQRTGQPVEPAPSAAAPDFDTHYQAIIQRGPEYIDALRAEPAPGQPQVVEGKSELGDQRELASQGYVRIGNGRYAQVDAGTMRLAIELGRDVGADRMLLYPHHRDDDQAQAPDQFLVAYYVRFKLLFGATFRNMTASERQRLGVESGVQIGSVVGGTPASQANLMSGDYVVSFNGKPIRDRGAFQEMLLDAAGKAVTLGVRRGQQDVTRVVRLGARPQSAGQP
jgi:hypothetical protein